MFLIKILIYLYMKHKNEYIKMDLKEFIKEHERIIKALDIIKNEQQKQKKELNDIKKKYNVNK